MKRKCFSSILSIVHIEYLKYWCYSLSNVYKYLRELWWPFPSTSLLELEWIIFSMHDNRDKIRDVNQKRHSNFRKNMSTMSNSAKIIILVVAGVLSSIIYYLYLNHLYLLDEVLEIDKLREKTMDEKLTLIIEPSISEPSLRSFVSYYSLCTCVHEIIIAWETSNFPSSDYFQYAHTHSKVTFSKRLVSSSYPSIYDIYVGDQYKIDTEGTDYIRSELIARIICNTSTCSFCIDWNSFVSAVMFMDVDIHVSCEDLAFTHNVWRSGNESIVGYFPRLHR
jgi:hypothetical protein